MDKKRYTAELFDQMQFFFQEYNDHQVRGVLYFDGRIDADILKKAALLSIKQVPILGCRFVMDERPYWEEIEESGYGNIVSFMESRDPDGEIQRFISGKTNELTGPQLMVRVVRASGRDAVCIVMNHMICDGAGFKEYLYLLGEIYTRLKSGVNGSFEYPKGARSLNQIYKPFGMSQRLKIFLLPNETTKEKNAVCFPLSGKGDDRPFIVMHKLSKGRFERLKKYAKKHSVTINDIFLAAYFRVLNKMLDMDQNNPLTIPCMVDLRRYLHDKNTAGICNLTSAVYFGAAFTEEETFLETVKKVNLKMNEKKASYPGLQGLSILHTLFKFLSFYKVQKLLKERFANPMIAMSNIGVIDSGRLVFGNTPVKDAFITGSIKHQPYFQLALSTFKGSVTCSFGEYGLKQDESLIKEFLLLLDKELQIESD